MNARADRARKAATADAFLKNRDRQRKVASKRDMTSHIEVGNEQVQLENRMREEDRQFVQRMKELYPQLYRGTR